MPQTTLLLQRLDEIGQALQKSGQALALLGLGSVGVERARLDEYSDLDFFAVVKDGCKPAFLRDLAWLSAIHPVAYSFQNTPDGYKLLFEDDVYCEFAIFETRELENATYAEGEIIWQAPEFDAALRRPKRPPPPPEAHSVEWQLGEALTCLYVGLGRYHRGEKLSAFRFVQLFVVDRIVEMAKEWEPENPAFRDTFAAERRFEARFPQTAQALPAFMQGYDAVPQSARAIVEFLDRHFVLNAQMKAAILKLCG
jgi:lincosamide nucleotidyltransferase B/F